MTCPPPAGIMLRWLPTAALGFPPRDYELERAPVPDVSTLDWQPRVADIAGQTTFSLSTRCCRPTNR
jgi:hypothetical protein